MSTIADLASALRDLHVIWQTPSVDGQHAAKDAEAREMLWHAWKAEAARVRSGRDLAEAITAPVPVDDPLEGWGGFQPSAATPPPDDAAQRAWEALGGVGPPPGPNDSRQDPVLPPPGAAQRLSELLPGLAPQAPSEDRTYDDFVALAQVLQRSDVPGFIRQWFRDIQGGFDGSSSAQRVDTYNRAVDYYKNRQGDAAGGPVDTTKCFRCGSVGQRKDGRNGAFFSCTNQTCGFQGRNGWMQTTWDETGGPNGWHAKKAKLDQIRRGGQQRSFAGR